MHPHIETPVGLGIFHRPDQGGISGCIMGPGQTSPNPYPPFTMAVFRLT